MDWFDFVPKIGVIGLGFVGSAVANAYSSVQVVAIDTDPSKECTASYSDLKDCEAVFVCVPSPMNSDGTCDTTILEQVLNTLWSMSYDGVIISKVTAPPDVYKKLQSCHKNLVYIPEFLTSANAKADYLKTTSIIIGGSIRAYRYEAERVIKYATPDVSVHHCSIGEASMVKYVVNSFLATKVVFMNEMAQLAAANDYEWDNIRKMLSVDDRLGNSHMRVPGPDGHAGFGGACFPKDVSAIIEHAKNLNISLNVLKEANRKNSLLRLTEPK